MRSKMSVAAVTLSLGLAGAAGACSSDDDPPATDPPATDTPASSSAIEVSDTDATPIGSAPSTGLGSIDGPATVDPDFGGANPGGDDTGG